jgi:transmembrane sensor
MPVSLNALLPEQTMSTRKQFTAQKAAIEEQASRWIVEAEEGMTPERKAAFAAWRSADVRHEVAVQELQATWSRLSRLDKLPAKVNSRPDPDLLAPRRWRLFGRNWMLGGLASATLAAGVILTFTLFVIKPFGQSDDTDSGMLVTTSTHDYTRLNLDDGSVLEVNANSAVRVNYQDSVRLVELLRGEAHFDVRKDALRPFLVKVDGMVFKAVGTAFNIRMERDEVKLLVTEGRVAVDRLDGPKPQAKVSAQRKTEPPETVIQSVSAGQLATFAKQVTTPEPKVHDLDRETIEAALAWKGPRLFFDGTPIAEAVRQFNEHGSVRVTVADPEIGNLRIGGSFLVSDVDAFLRLLEINNRIAVDRISPDEAVIHMENPL